jgi:hypothetical protein
MLDELLNAKQMPCVANEQAVRRGVGDKDAYAPCSLALWLLCC